MDGDGEDRMELIRPVKPAEFWAHVDRAIEEKEGAQ